MRIMAIVLACVLAGACMGETRKLPRAEFLDKMKGAWAGQMFGVCFGAPWEFRSNGAMITKDLGEWRPENIKDAIGQDDCYVEMTFLKALEDYGLDVTAQEAGKAFGESEYPLWHANKAGRNNIRRGIMPPGSGNPIFNIHADDIDFQIEADVFGILCPGLPQESNKLCDVFGHIMNYGDGVYGGMFVAGMYTAAYFEPKDVEKVVRAGLACIPRGTKYHETITDVLAWRKLHPDDWQKVWQLIEDKYQDDVDCEPGNKFNINANLNGAYIVMGLLYGEGDMMKTAEMAIRCGQDADCNPSNACGVLGCMKGFSRLGDTVTSGIPAMARIPFDHTAYSFDGLANACEHVSEQIIAQSGGRSTKRAFHIQVQQPLAPLRVEAWLPFLKVHQLAQVVLQSEVARWNQHFRLDACGRDMEPGLLDEYRGMKDVLRVHPVSEKLPAVLTADCHFEPGPVDVVQHMSLAVASDERGDFLLRVLVNGVVSLELLVDTHGEWTKIEVPLVADFAHPVRIEIQVAANGWSYEAACLGKIELPRFLPTL